MASLFDSSDFVVGYSSSQQFESCNQLFAKNRMEGLGPVVQHRIIAGTYFLSYRYVFVILESLQLCVCESWGLAQEC